MNRKCVALSLQYQHALGCRMVQGILDYAREAGDWEIVTPFIGTPVEQIRLNRTRVDGVIADLYESRQMVHARAISKPLIVVGNSLPGHGFPEVHSDEPAIGRMAAEYFLEHKFRNVTFCGYEGHHYSDLRFAAFRKILESHGRRLIEPHIGRWRDSPTDEFMLVPLSRWLSKLPRPCAVFACSDIRAVTIHQACGLAGLAIPSDILLLGVDNEDTLIAHYGLELSTIEQDTHMIGWKAAQTLDGMMGGQPWPTRPTLVPPRQVIERMSTRTQPDVDPVIQEALRLMRRHAFSNLSVSEIVQQLPLSRRSLERRFVEQVGHPPKKEISRLRLERACDLLCSTSMSMQEISREIGFEEQRQLTRLFKRELNLTPKQYRRLRSGALTA